MCQSFSPQMIKGHPCPFCRKTVYDKRKHPEQCVILFQVCFGWQRVHGTHETSDSRSAPKPDSTVTRPLHAFFKKPQQDGSNRPAVEESAPIAPRKNGHGSWALSTCSHHAKHWQHMLCQRHLAPELGADDTSAELEPLLHHCSNHNQEQRPLNPTGLFSLRSLMPRWKFDGRQQDAAEFLTFLLQGNTGAFQPVDWQGHTDGILEAEDQGLTPLVLPLTRVCVTLQQACTAWYNHSYQRALAWAPDILPVVIVRWADGQKNTTLLDLRQRLSLPTWGPAQTREWHTYEVKSAYITSVTP